MLKSSIVIERSKASDHAPSHFRFYFWSLTTPPREKGWRCGGGFRRSFRPAYPPTTAYGNRRPAPRRRLLHRRWRGHDARSSGKTHPSSAVGDAALRWILLASLRFRVYVPVMFFSRQRERCVRQGAEIARRSRRVSGFENASHCWENDDF